MDGDLFGASAYSYSSGRYYDIDIEFDGADAILWFSNGIYRWVELDDDDFDPRDTISAYDWQTGSYWDIDLDSRRCRL